MLNPRMFQDFFCFYMYIVLSIDLTLLQSYIQMKTFPKLIFISYSFHLSSCSCLALLLQLYKPTVFSYVNFSSGISVD